MTHYVVDVSLPGLIPWEDRRLNAYNGDLVKVPVVRHNDYTLGCKFSASPGLYKVVYKSVNKYEEPLYLKLTQETNSTIRVGLYFYRVRIGLENT
jgi:hypothetical protein